MGVIRGAICAENTEQDISIKATALIGEILEKNNICVDEIDAILFSATNDLDACYPAKAVRERFDMNNVAFMCVAEMSVKGSLDHCLRVCVLTLKRNQSECRHCYLGRASVLRSDLEL